MWFYRLSVFSFAVLFGLWTQASDLNCPENTEPKSPYSVTLMPKSDCLWHFKGLSQSNSFRDFAINGLGMMEVHVADSTTRKLGTRAYMMFPLTQHPNVEYDADAQKLVVHLASGEAMEFSEPDHKLTNYTGGSVKEDSSFSMSHQSGFEITNSTGILFDCGWSTAGKTPLVLPGSCKITDKNGEKCQIPHEQLFRVQHYDPIPRYPTNEAMAGFLRKRCPHLQLWDPVRKPVAPLPVKAVTPEDVKVDFVPIDIKSALPAPVVDTPVSEPSAREAPAKSDAQ